MKNAVRLFFVLCVAAVIVSIAGCRAGGGSMTKEEWWSKLEQNGLKFAGNRAVVDVPKEKFLQIMGNPDKTQSVGDQVYWYYACRDGMIQMVMSQLLLNTYGKIATDSINEL